MLAVRRSGRTLIVSILTTRIPNADADSLVPSNRFSFCPSMQLRSAWFQRLRIRSGPYSVVKNRASSEDSHANS